MAPVVINTRQERVRYLQRSNYSSRLYWLIKAKLCRECLGDNATDFVYYIGKIQRTSPESILHR